MAVKIAVILCLLGLARAGNLAGGIGYGSGLGQPGLGYVSHLGLGSGLASWTNPGHSLGLGYGSGLGLGSNVVYDTSLGYETNNLRYGNGWQSYEIGSYGYGGYGSGAYSYAGLGSRGGYAGYADVGGPATSTVSIKKFSGSPLPYSTRLGGHGVYGTGSGADGYGGLGGYSGNGDNSGYGKTGFATSTVSIKKYSGPAVPYSTGYSGQEAYGPVGGQGYSGYGHSGYGYGIGGYGKKW